MQLDETTDISKCRQHLVFIHCDDPDSIKEFLFYDLLFKTTKTVDVLEKVKSFFSEQNFY
jgi:hypothetical protein